MTTVPQYSKLISCIYDEPAPIGNLGRGTHYSVFRCAEWFDVTRQPLVSAQVHDFAVIWDEDHDIRVIDAVERIYMKGLLSPVQFIGERKGFLNVIVAARFFFSGAETSIEDYGRQIEAISQELDDPWPAEVGMFDRQIGSHQNSFGGLISAEDSRVEVYLRNIDSLWKLGTRPFIPSQYSENLTSLFPPQG